VSKLKLSRELAKIPVEKYRMSKDGRKWAAVARNRMMLADFLGNFGDGDGTRIFPAVSTMAKKFGWSEAKTYYLLADLRELRLLENTRHYSGPQHRRTRVRQMNVNTFLSPPPEPPLSGLQDSTFQDSKIEQDSNIQDSNFHTQDSKIGGQHSKIEAQDSNVWLEPTDTLPSPNRHSDRHKASVAKTAPFVLPEWVPVQEWNDWIEMRKLLKKPATRAAVQLALSKLEKWADEGQNPKLILEQSILHSWQGLFPLRVENNNGKSQLTADEKTAQIMKNAFPSGHPRSKIN
jgi:hypothetical protein